MDHQSTSDTDDPNITPQRKAAIKAWNLIRTKIEEVADENKKNSTSFNWTFLSQHIAYMTDQQKARQDLYDKYIHNTNTWADGLVNYPHYLFTKSRQRALKYKWARSMSLGLPTSSLKRSGKKSATSQGTKSLK